jgi:hypothetical protein
MNAKSAKIWQKNCFDIYRQMLISVNRGGLTLSLSVFYLFLHSLAGEILGFPAKAFFVFFTSPMLFIKQGVRKIQSRTNWEYSKNIYAPNAYAAGLKNQKLF